MNDGPDDPSSRFTFGYWLNGWRKNPEDTSPDVLCVETGRYGLKLDVADLTRLQFGILDDDTHYGDALTKGLSRLEGLKPAELEIALEVNGTTYRATHCRASKSRDVQRLKDIKLWESARLVQHFEFFDPVFEDESGNTLGCMASLNLVAWPEHFGLTAEVIPQTKTEAGPADGVHGAGLSIGDVPRDIPHQPGMDPECFTVELWFNMRDFCAPHPEGWLLSKNGNEQQDGYYGFYVDGRKVCAVMNVGGGPDGECLIPQKAWMMPTGQWCHVAMTYDGNVMRFYLDGELQGEKSVGLARKPGSGHIRIGQRADGHGPTTVALYDQLRVWDRVLTQHELAGHCAKPGLVPSRNGLVHEESFSEYDDKIPAEEPWRDAVLRIRFADGSREWSAENRVNDVWKKGILERVTIDCDVVQAAARNQDAPITVWSLSGDSISVEYEPAFSGYVSRVNDVARPKPDEPGDVRAYDEFVIEVHPSSEAVPFLFFLSPPASITGLCPLLCEMNGTPTGIPVQLSKNWHETKLGAYLRAYMMLPAAGESRRYLLRIVYGFYGTLPSASHSQLSLVGWGCNGRWDQLAIGCWGETFCLDMDLSPTEQTITDVRAMLVRAGKDGPKWQWSEAGWGGDWLNISDDKGNRHRFSELKTAYFSHGPCLSDVRYVGHYGAKREARLDATVRTLRTDDYVRTFQTFRFVIDAEVSLQNGWLHKMGNTHNLSTPYVAYGNRDGLISEIKGPHIEGLGEEAIEPGTGALKPKHSMDHLDPVVDMVTVEGDGPWWVAFPGAEPILPKGRVAFGHASKAMVIREYRASIGGANVSAPTIHMKVHAINADSTPNIDLLLMPPGGVSSLNPGDWIEMDVEWMTVPRMADDYYGPNEALREHMESNPCSWKTVHREAAGNELEFNVVGGTVKNRYPVIIEAKDSPVAVEIKGGVGAVPIRFDGLANAKGYTLYEVTEGKEAALDQSVKGNDFWQTDYDAGSDTYSITFNLELDGKPSSKWVLRKSPVTSHQLAVVSGGAVPSPRKVDGK